jgi:hypothetical protein
VRATCIVRALVGIVALGLVAAACGQDGGNDRTESPAAATDGPQVYEGTFTVLESDAHGPALCSKVLDSLPPQCGDLPLLNWDWDAVEGETIMNDTTWGIWHVTGTYSRDGFTLTEPPGPPESGDPAAPGGPDPDLSPACDEPDGAGITNARQLWEGGWASGSLPLIPDVVAMWVSQSPYVVNFIVRPGTGATSTAAVRRGYAGPLCVVERDLPTLNELGAVQDEVVDAAAREALRPLAAWSDHQRGVVVVQVWVPEPDVTDYAHDRWGDRVELQGILQPVDA